VLLACWTLSAFADSITVHATVPDTPPSTAATISSPLNGARFTSVPVNVTGTCTGNTYYVEIFRDNVLSGTAICQADDTYQLLVDLFAGKNEFVPHVFNITDNEGPVGLTTTVYYNVPQQPTNPSSPSPEISINKPTLNVEPLTLTSDFKVRGYYVGENVKWELQITGGTKPFAVNVNWGDGKNSVISITKPGNFTIEHVYTAKGGYKGSYPVKISASDSEGRQAYMQVFIIVSPKTAPVAGTGGIYNTPSSSFFSAHESLLKYLWPAYGIVALMALSFELGEKEEIIVLRGIGRRARRRT
jgi:hypothetical protein